MRPSELIPGNCYFFVSYYDRDLRLPAISTLLFIGREDAAAPHRWIFREPGEDDTETAFEDGQLWQILDLRGLIRQLGGLVHLHPPVPASTRPRWQFPELERLFAAGPPPSVSITIKYTNDGLSLSTKGDRVEWSFHPNEKMEPERVAKIRSIFDELQATPTRDDLASAERIRSLAYELPRDAEATRALCARLFAEVFEMREDDELVFSF